MMASLTERMTSYDMTEPNLDENVAVLMSDFMTLAQSLLTVSRREWCASKKALQKILNERTKGVLFVTRKQGRYEDLLKGKIDVDFVVHIWNERTTAILF